MGRVPFSAGWFAVHRKGLRAREEKGSERSVVNAFVVVAIVHLPPIGYHLLPTGLTRSQGTHREKSRKATSFSLRREDLGMTKKNYPENLVDERGP